MFDPSAVPHNLFGEVLRTKDLGGDTFGCEDSEQVMYVRSYEIGEVKRTPRSRVDLNRRKMLRRVKRFYYELFKFHNNRLFNTRLTKVSSDISLKACEDFCSVYIQG